MPEPDNKAQAAEAAAIQRRWITLGEVLAVVAVVISGLTLWNSYQERESQAAERAAEKADETRRAATLLLRGTANADRSRLDLAPTDAGQTVQAVTIAFPSALDAERIDTVIRPRIEGAWIKEALGKARLRRERRSAGDQRLPVAITTRFESGGSSLSGTAIYDVGYTLEKGFLDDTDVVLAGLSLIERTGAKEAQATLDRLWAARQPQLAAPEE